MIITVKNLIEATHGTIVYGAESAIFQFVETDSRKEMSGKLFIPIKGEKFDGHHFILNAKENNAAGFISHNPEEIHGFTFQVKVADTKKALGDLARFVINQSQAKVIGITGSVGKTTTRQFISSVVGKIGKTIATEGNLNNDIGLPLTILKMQGDERFAILEMGMNHLGEIAYLSNIAKPDIAVITTIGTSHIENLGCVENILKAKLEILDGLKDNGIVVLNGDDKILRSLELPKKVTYYGIEALDVHIYKEYFMVENEKYEIHIEGEHNIINATSAIVIGKILGSRYLQIKAGLNEFIPVNLRQSIEKIGDIEVIVDCYNSSYDSCVAGLKVLKNRAGKRKVAILGAIKELGDFTESILNKVGNEVYNQGIDLLICVDENSDYIQQGALEGGMKNVLKYETKEEFYIDMMNIIKKEDVLLIKASRGYKFEEIYHKIKELYNRKI